MRPRLAVLALLISAAPAWADATLGFTPPAMATPTPVTAGNGNDFVGDSAALLGYNSWNTMVGDTLTAQGFVPEYNWFYGPTAGGPATPVTFANNANFDVSTYQLHLNPGNNNQGGEEIDFSLALGNTAPPTLDGATVTAHWLQLVHSSAPVNGYGFSIPALGGGYWQIDNGQVTETGGTAAPFYDSNNAPGASVPPDFFDFPQWYDASPGFYLQFWTMMSWDMQEGSQHDIVVGNQAVSWGFAATPEPSSLALGGVGVLVVVVGRWVRRSRTADRGCRGKGEERKVKSAE